MMRLSPLLLALLVTACGGPTVVTPPPPDLTDGLKELAEVYKYRADMKQPAPGRLEDLTEHQAALGNAWRLIQDGAIVVVWKSGYSSNSGEVLAYEKQVPTSGGKVLLRNGSVKQIGADEFTLSIK